MIKNEIRGLIENCNKLHVAIVPSNILMEILYDYVRMHEALEFYADINNWTGHHWDDLPGIIKIEDLESEIALDFKDRQIPYLIPFGGKKAREVLKEVGGE